MCSIVTSHFSLSAAWKHNCSSRLAVLRFIPTFFKSALSVLSRQVLGLPRLALGMLFTVRSNASLPYIKVGIIVLVALNILIQSSSSFGTRELC